MIAPQPIGFVNTGLPLMLLGTLALVLPWVLVPPGTRSHGVVAAVIGICLGLLLLCGASVFAAIYAAGGVGVGAALVEAPLATTKFFLRLSGYAALIWGPLLALMWLGLAQRVEKRRGQDQVKL